MWVVVRPDSDRDRVQELGYLSKEKAEQRAQHVRETDYFDDRHPEVWPVSVYLDSGAVAVAPVRKPGPPGSTVATVSRGTELTAYEMPERRFSMASVISSAASSGALSPTDAGALREALLERPDIPPGVFEEHEGQLRLFPRDLP